MTIWAALAGGFAGNVALTTALRAASELGMTRIDLPFLAGTLFTSNRSRAKVYGYLLHLGFGFLFSLLYYAVFVAIGKTGWLLGALFGAVHAVFILTTLVNVVLPAIHPLMGSPFTASNSAPLLEPPGFMMLNYGRSTPLVTLLAHIAYGAVIGAFLKFSQ